MKFTTHIIKAPPNALVYDQIAAELTTFPSALVEL